MDLWHEMINIYYSCYDQNSKELNWESHHLFVSIHRSTLKLILRYQSLQTNKGDHTFLTQKWLHAKVIQKIRLENHGGGCNLRPIQWKAILAIPSLGKGLVGFDTSPGSAKSLLVAPMAFYVAVGTKRAKEAFTKTNAFHLDLETIRCLQLIIQNTLANMVKIWKLNMYIYIYMYIHIYIYICTLYT